MSVISRYFSNRATVFGFGAVLGLSSLLAIILLLQVDTWSKAGFELVRNNMHQAQLIIEMRDAVQKRALIVQRMISMRGSFDRDAQSMRFYQLAGQYSAARDQLLHTQLDESLRDSLQQLDNAVAYAQPYHNRLVETMVFEEMDTAELEAIFDEGNKASEKVLFLLDKIVERQSSSYQKVIEKYERSRRYTVLGVSGIFALIIGVMLYAVRSSTRQIRNFSRMSIIDEITDIYNRRYFDMVMEEEWKRSMREYTPISLLMMDIDFFKAYNDQFGHQKGDECLQMIAQILKDQLKRASDLTARYGGEEFVVVLPNTTAEHARLLAERIRRAVENARIKAGVDTVSPWVTISIGVATTTAEFEQKSSRLVEAADNCLYQSKRSGRNRVSDCQLDNVS